MEGVAYIESGEEMGLETDLLEIYADQEVAVFGITGKLRDLAGMCPIDLDDPSVTTAAKNEFVVKVANESAMEIAPEHEEYFSRVIEKHDEERKFTIASPAEASTPEVQPDPLKIIIHKPVTNMEPLDPSPELLRAVHRIEQPMRAGGTDQDVTPKPTPNETVAHHGVVSEVTTPQPAPEMLAKATDEPSKPPHIDIVTEREEVAIHPELAPPVLSSDLEPIAEMVDVEAARLPIDDIVLSRIKPLDTTPKVEMPAPPSVNSQPKIARASPQVHEQDPLSLQDDSGEVPGSSNVTAELVPYDYEGVGLLEKFTDRLMNNEPQAEEVYPEPLRLPDIVVAVNECLQELVSEEETIEPILLEVIESVEIIEIMALQIEDVEPELLETMYCRLEESIVALFEELGIAYEQEDVEIFMRILLPQELQLLKPESTKHIFTRSLELDGTREAKLHVHKLAMSLFFGAKRDIRCLLGAITLGRTARRIPQKVYLSEA